MKIKPLTAAMRPFSIVIAALAVSACATPHGTVAVVNVTRNNAGTFPTPLVTVSVPRHSASSGSSALSSIPPATIRVLPLDDNRKDIDTEGKSTAAFGVPMGRIRFEPGPATLLGQTISSEIRAAGHTVTDRAAGLQITGAILEFEAHTDTTLLYWDVIGNVAVSLQILPAQGSNPAVPIDYRARCVDRTYIWPSEAVIAGVMGKCIHDFANKLRNDGRAAVAFRAASGL